MGYVYLICDPATDTYKIGVTKNIVQNRLKKLQTGNSSELHIITYKETEYPYKLESMLHNMFKYKLEHGEWYKLDPDDVFNFNKTCDMLINRIKILLDNPYFNKNLK